MTQKHPTTSPPRKLQQSGTPRTPRMPRMSWTFSKVGRAQPRGFSLVEILVVIAIIILLMGLIIPMFTNRKGTQSATRITLDALKAASVEYEAETKQMATSVNSGIYASDVPKNYADTQYVAQTHNPPPTKAIIGASESDPTKKFEAYSISIFVHQLLKRPTTNKMILSLGNQVFLDSDEDNFADVIDGWGNKIVYYNPNDTNTYNSDILKKFPKSRTPYFASAGADGKWGDYSQLLEYRKASDPESSMSATNIKLANQAMDNLYSFEQGH